MKSALALIGLLSVAPSAWAGCAGDCSRQETAEIATSWSGDAKAPTRLILSSSSHAHGGQVWIALEMNIADDVIVMEKGRLVERDAASRVLTEPEAPYTRRLLAAVPKSARRWGWMTAPLRCSQPMCSVTA